MPPNLVLQHIKHVQDLMSLRYDFLFQLIIIVGVCLLFCVSYIGWRLNKELKAVEGRIARLESGEEGRRPKG